MMLDPEPSGSAVSHGEPVQPDLFGDVPPAMPAKLAAHPLYGVWRNMCQRCENPKNPDFRNYGQRGIVVCEEWRSSSREFIAWAICDGWKPGLEIDRKDNDGPYSPANCRFVTRRVNNQNTRLAVRLPDGRAARSVALSRGVNVKTFGSRILRGWSPAQAAGLEPPPRCGKAGRISPFRDADRLLLSRAAAESGVSMNSVYRRVRAGWTYLEAVGVDPAPLPGPAPVQSESSAL